MSYLFKNNFEIAGRYVMTQPSIKLYDNSEAPSLNEKQSETYEMGFTRYFNNHRVKVQGGIVYTRLPDLSTETFSIEFWTAAFQIEPGI